MAEQIKQLIDNPDLSHSAPEKALETVNANYTKEAITKEFQKILN